jgi:hypothetical protein
MPFVNVAVPHEDSADPEPPSISRRDQPERIEDPTPVRIPDVLEKRKDNRKRMKDAWEEHKEDKPQPPPPGGIDVDWTNADDNTLYQNTGNRWLVTDGNTMYEVGHLEASSLEIVLVAIALLLLGSLLAVMLISEDKEKTVKVTKVQYPDEKRRNTAIFEPYRDETLIKDIKRRSMTIPGEIGKELASLGRKMSINGIPAEIRSILEDEDGIANGIKRVSRNITESPCCSRRRSTNGAPMPTDILKCEARRLGAHSAPFE